MDISAGANSFHRLNGFQLEELHMPAATDWWRTFFSGMAVDFWLQATTEEQTRQESDFIQQKLNVAAPAKLLDVPCGGGRHTLALAARGYHLTGVDSSTDALAAARTVASTRPTMLQWERRDMRDLPWREEFDGAFCFGNSFGYYDDDGNAAFLKAVAAVLKPGARFLLDDSYISEILLPSLQERGWYQTGTILTLSDRHYDPVHGRLHVEYTFIRDGQTEKRSMSARLYSYRELLRLFEEAGFVDIEGVSSLTGEPFKFGSKRLLMSATKKAR
jgi:SAM-dependent methyltransferase